MTEIEKWSDNKQESKKVWNENCRYRNGQKNSTETQVRVVGKKENQNNGTE